MSARIPVSPLTGLLVFPAVPPTASAVGYVVASLRDSGENRGAGQRSLLSGAIRETVLIGCGFFRRFLAFH